MPTLAQSRPSILAIDCPETIETVTLPWIEEQIEGLTKRICAALGAGDAIPEDSRRFAMEMLAEAREELPAGLDLTETVFRRAVAASSLSVAARELKA